MRSRTGRHARRSVDCFSDRGFVVVPSGLTLAGSLIGAAAAPCSLGLQGATGEAMVREVVAGRARYPEW